MSISRTEPLLPWAAAGLMLSRCRGGPVQFTDRLLFVRAAQEGRAIVTEDRADFGRIVQDTPDEVDQHAGVVFVSPTRFPRRPSTYPHLIEALAALFEANTGEHVLVGSIHWLASVENTA